MPHYTFTLQPTDAPITEAVTKFGGQPVWIDGPEWPHSRETGAPMQFIAQIALIPQVFGDLPVQMAYLFMTDGEDTDGTWEPDSGENALILQPGGDNPATRPLENGPTLYRRYDENYKPLAELKPVEYHVELKLVEDQGKEPPDAKDDEAGAITNQIGGEPNWLQGEEYPDESGWRLVLQLDSGDVPFDVNFGDVGVGYALIAADGRRGKFLWQCT